MSFISRQAQIDPRNNQPPVCDPRIFARKLKNRQKFIGIAAPLMKMLCNFHRESGFAVILADEEGYILETVGDQDVVETTRRWNMVKGACWNESVAGTNAIGTCLLLGEPLQVCASEHYWNGSHAWSCAAAPIRNPEGNITGVLNMIGIYEKMHPNTLDMVVSAVNAIENHLRTIAAMEKLEFSDRYKNTIIETMAEGILTVDHNNYITQINSQARKILDLPMKEFVGRPVRDILAPNHPLSEIFVKGLNKTDEELYLETHHGAIHCTVNCHQIRTQGKHAGKVLVLREFNTIKQLVRKIMGAEARFNFSNLIGQNTAFLSTVKNAKVAAATIANVLLSGENGTEKELFAQAIHNYSSRCRGPFIALNCAALPRDLAGCAIFGYTEGAFTGAKQGGAPGKFELADGGTLFLDEIGELPLETQLNLLRALQEKQITRIGGQKVITVNVRIIAATSKNLLNEINRGTFRSDLFFRLNALTINIPPLRERKEDIPMLVKFFIENLTRNTQQEVNIMTSQAMDCLLSYSWPGNIRELQNILEQAISSCSGKIIKPENLPKYIMAEAQTINNDGLVLESGNGSDPGERETILKLLDTYFGNISMIARRLGISRPTLYRKLQAHRITLPKQNQNHP